MADVATGTNSATPGADNAAATPLSDSEADALFATFAEETPEPSPAPAADTTAAAADVTATDPQAGATGAAAPAPAQATERAAQAAPQVDWSKVDPAIKAVFDGQAAELATTKSHLTRARGQQSRLALQLQPLIGHGAASATDPTRKDTPVRQTETPEFKKLEADFPEVAVPLKPVLNAQDDQIAAIRQTTSVLARGEVDAHHMSNADALMERHPDYPQLVAAGAPAKAFQEWRDHQPGYVKDLINKNAQEVVDVDAADHVMSLYKAHLHEAVAKVGGGGGARPAGGAIPQPDPNPQAAHRARQLAASMVPTRATGAKTVALPDDPEKLFGFYADRVVAKQKGSR